ncbi:MAG: holo-ACP synthase [Alphaproteobacteria bacterium]|nr:holo-ACP synthase [Alphaproteobacteria bacterium]MCD8570156.1 holo-ACP synthase [Alphaproteobacteria bacterium]
MIIGIGSDILDLRRFEKVFGKHEARFIARVFTMQEQKKAERRRSAGTHIATYAKRFAAKEACSKALGTGFADGVFMKDIGVVNDAAGKPDLVLSGGALKRLESLIPPGHKPRLHLTLTDEPPIMQAFVVIEAV